MHTSWNSAAEAAVKEIYAAEVRPCGVEDLRSHLDGLIEKYLPTGGDVTAGGSRRMRESWVELGQLARALGANMDFLNSCAQTTRLRPREYCTLRSTRSSGPSARQDCTS